MKVHSHKETKKTKLVSKLTLDETDIREFLRIKGMDIGKDTKIVSTVTVPSGGSYSGSELNIGSTIDDVQINVVLTNEEEYKAEED